jgi:hypothetical protein
MGLKPRKPVLTDRVLDGIITAAVTLQAGDVASAFGQDDAETRKLWDDVSRACEWASAMKRYRTAVSQTKAKA